MVTTLRCSVLWRCWQGVFDAELCDASARRERLRKRQTPPPAGGRAPGLDGEVAQARGAAEQRPQPRGAEDRRPLGRCGAAVAGERGRERERRDGGARDVVAGAASRDLRLGVAGVQGVGAVEAEQVFVMMASGWRGKAGGVVV